MVRNPKRSTQLLLWSIETALVLLFRLFEITRDKISESELGDYFRKKMKGLGVSNQQIAKTIYDLKKRNFIDFQHDDSVVLTHKAKMRLIDDYAKKSGGDGKYRLVSFDIPESHTKSRDSFRRAIKRMGFVQVQRSLWVSDKNLGEMVESATEEYKVDDFVAYFIVDSSNIDNHIKEILKVRDIASSGIVSKNTTPSSKS